MTNVQVAMKRDEKSPFLNDLQRICSEIVEMSCIFTSASAIWHIYTKNIYSLTVTEPLTVTTNTWQVPRGVLEELRSLHKFLIEKLGTTGKCPTVNRRLETLYSLNFLLNFQWANLKIKCTGTYFWLQIKWTAHWLVIDFKKVFVLLKGRKCPSLKRWRKDKMHRINTALADRKGTELEITPNHCRCKYQTNIDSHDRCRHGRVKQTLCS